MARYRTGVFYHPSFSRRSYLTVGTRLADFPGALGEIVKSDRVLLCESEPVSRELLLKVHAPDLLERVRLDPLCSTAWHSAGGVVGAGEKIATGEIANAFVFIGAGGHHAGRSEFGGFCCFNDVALCVVNLREKFGLERFAIVDTDAHHADGTLDIIQDDPGVLYICFCGAGHVSGDGTRIDVDYGRALERSALEANSERAANEAYFDLVARHVPDRVRRFAPDLLFWYFGFDTHLGDYGDIGLTGPCYGNIADLMIGLAGEVCSGRLEVVLGGGSHRHLAAELIPPIIERLAAL